MTPYHHALSSAHKWGGCVQDYMPIHEWFDETKGHYGDPRHRAARHHSEGVVMCEKIFGTTLTTMAGRQIPVRWVAEQHVMEDCGFIPSLKDWLQHIEIQPWMRKVGTKSVEVEVQ